MCFWCAAQLEAIQSLLLDAGSAIATPLDTSSDRKKARVEFPDTHAETLEVGKLGGGEHGRGTERVASRERVKMEGGLETVAN